MNKVIKTAKEVADEKRLRAIENILETGKTAIGKKKKKGSHEKKFALAESDRKLLRKYVQELTSNTAIVSIHSRLTFLTNLIIDERKEKGKNNLLGKGFNQITADDLRKYISKIQPDIKPASLFAYQIHIKSFWKWLGKEEMVSWIKPKISTCQREKLSFDKFLNATDIKKMLQYAICDRDRALIHVLFESGARATEILNLTIADVEFRESHCTIQIRKGKTGGRSVVLINSFPALQNYFETMPDKDKENENSPLWVAYSNKWGEPLGWSGLYKILSKTTRRAGIKKKCNPHSLRHSQATIWAEQGYTEVQMRQRFGWSDSSKTPSIYIHANQDLGNNSYLEKNGIIDKKKTAEKAEEEKALKPVECERCQTINPAGFFYCKRCGKALTVEAAIRLEKIQNHRQNYFKKMEKTMKKLDSMYEIMMKHPKAPAVFEKLVEEVKTMEAKEYTDANMEYTEE